MSKNFRPGTGLIQALQAILDLKDRPVRTITIRADHADLVTVSVELAVTTEQLDRIANLLRQDRID